MNHKKSILNNALSVRQTEALVKRLSGAGSEVSESKEEAENKMSSLEFGMGLQVYEY